MYSQCPQCLTVFTLDAATLAMAHGCVCCSECGATFDTIATLTDALPDTPFETLPVNDPAPAPPLLVDRVHHEAPAQRALFEGVFGDDEPLPPEDESDYGIGAESSPDDIVGAVELPHAFRQQPRLHGRQRHWLQAGCATLALVLVLQLAWAERASPQLRGLCATLGCPLPPIRDVDQLALLSRDIRRHPSVDDALLISASLRNDADFRQPWPVVAITLSDLDDHRIAMRRFRPTEYLHSAEVRDAGIAPGATAALVFEVHDPGSNAVAFEFRFE